MSVTVSFSAPGVPVLTPTLTDAVQAAWSYRNAAQVASASATASADAITSLHSQFTIEYAAFVTAGQTFEINMANVYGAFDADYALWLAARDAALVGIEDAKDAAIAAVEGALDVPPPVTFTPATASATLVVGKQYSLDATTGTITLTLPASPAEGDSIRIIDGATIGAGPTYIVARNGNTIGLVAEDVTLDVVGLDVIFRFKSGNWRLF